MKSQQKRKQGSGDRLHKINALAMRGATEGERSAATAAGARIQARELREIAEIIGADSPEKPKKAKRGVRLSADVVRKQVAPAKGAVTFWDDDLKAAGFGIRIYASGSRSFFINYRIDGREKRHTIGSFPLWTVEAAREKAKELRRDVDSGVDPAAKKQERRDAPTVGDLIDRYTADHLPQKKCSEQNKKAEKKMLEIIGHILGKNEKVTDIHNGDIQEMHRKLTESNGPIGANRILSCCSKMFSLACIAKIGERQPWRNQAEGNPCRGTPRNPENQRERFYSEQELERIVEALESYPGVGADVIRLVMLTGCRPSEARLARWSEFDHKPGFWIKPSAHTKKKKRHEISLAPEAVDLIESIRKKRNSKKLKVTHKNSEHVFPGDKPGKPIQTLHHVWKHVMEHAKLAPDEDGNSARPYDLRHTFATVGAGGGVSLPILGRLLGHTQARTTQRYAHIDKEPLRKAAEMIAAAIAKAGKGTAETVPS